MFSKPDVRLIVSANSDIAKYFAEKWSSNGIRVLGVTSSNERAISGIAQADLINIDISKKKEVAVLNNWIVKKELRLNYVLFATGTQYPVGNFYSTSFDAWEQSIEINTIAQLRILHVLRNLIRTQGSVFFFAGAGSNNAPKAYSAYISSKIHLTKMVELLSAEDQNVKYCIIGPGWVGTKIHGPTLDSDDINTSGNTSVTKEMFRIGTKFTSFEKIFDFFEKIHGLPREVISGRNFSVVYDAIDEGILIQTLIDNPDMYKLRRSGNDWKP